jgi:BirA family biotin operon repressor/biotin-[acetyl-CoA-carboxylase] ligase
MPDEKLDKLSILKGLTTRFIGQNLLYFPTLTSTNEIARLEALKQAPEGTAVIADIQTAGKGRFKRAWVTPAGNIAVTVVFYPDRKYLHFLTMLAALAVYRSIEKTTNLKCQLKWPNDVLINGKKVCGILLESQATADSVLYAMAGIGINVNMQMADYPEIAGFATSLSDETGSAVSRVLLLQNLFVEMESLYLRLQAGESILPEWRDKLITIGKAIHVRANDELFEGVCEAVADDGCLLLRCPDGKLLKFNAGDVSLK